MINVAAIPMIAESVSYTHLDVYKRQIENKEIKTDVFKKLEEIVSEKCVIGSNTSSISITSLSAELKKPERFIGIHFFNPAPLMPLVEVIPGLLTEKNLAPKIYALMESWGKTPVIAKDVPGFIVNRIARPFYCLLYTSRCV